MSHPADPRALELSGEQYDREGLGNCSPAGTRGGSPRGDPPAGGDLLLPGVYLLHPTGCLGERPVPGGGSIASSCLGKGEAVAA